MEYLKQISVDNWQQIPQLSQFYDDLAKKPYCTNSKGFTHIRTKSHAIQHTHVQPNHPAVIKWLVFDIDDPEALFSYHDNGLPRPQIIVKNPDNGHAHYCYRLTAPVSMWGDAHIKPIQYLRVVYRALAEALGADLSYSGNLIKNPCNPQHETYITGAKPSYTLAELSEHLDLIDIKKDIEPQNDDYFGRNCAVFHHTRHRAYPLADKLDANALLKEVLAIATEFNARFNNPLLPNEIYHIARSITRFCKSPRFGAYSDEFIERQRIKGRNGGLKSDSSSGGKARSAQYAERRKQAVIMHNKGMSKTKIAEKLGVSRPTVITWIKKWGCKSASQSDNSPSGAVWVSPFRLFSNPGTRSPTLNPVEEKNRGDQQIAPKPSVGNHAPAKVLTSKELMSLLYNSVYKPLPSLIGLSILQGHYCLSVKFTVTNKGDG